MKYLWWCLAFAASGLFQDVLSANILALIPFPSKSHGIYVESLLQELDSQGHSITLITFGKPHFPLGKTKIIEVKNIREGMMKNVAFPGGEKPNMFEMRHMTALAHVFMLPKFGLSVCETVFQNADVLKLIRSNEKFDLILGEIFVDESLLAGFAHRFKAPIIAIHTFMPNNWCNYLVGNPAPSAFIPDTFLGYSNHMTFKERVINFIYGTFAEFYYSVVHLAWQDELMRKHFDKDMPSIEAILKNTSFVFANHHYSIGFPRPYVPNMIEVAAIHVKEPKPLPSDLQTYMDGSKDGAILFSMGSNLQSSEFSPEMIKAILGAFSRLKQNVLWKFEAQLENLPKNVKIMKWLPQSDLLGHPNMKLFITHGGLMSTIESIHRGVPVVGIPIFGDQPINMRHTENAGLGKTLSFDDLNEENLYRSINEVISDPRYQANAKEKSKLMKDIPMQPLESAVWWVNYVLRHKGASHMRSAVQDLAWYEVYLLDVYAIFAIFLFTMLAINICILKAIGRKIFGLKSCCDRTVTVIDKKTDKKLN